MQAFGSYNDLMVRVNKEKQRPQKSHYHIDLNSLRNAETLNNVLHKKVLYPLYLLANHATKLTRQRVPEVQTDGYV